MTLKKIILFTTLITLANSLLAQINNFNAVDAESKKIQPIFKSDANMVSDPLNLEPNIQGLNVNHPSELTSLDSIQIQKTMEKTKALGDKWGASLKKTRANEPLFVNGFNANTTTSTPPDNTVAINSKGQIVSIINSNVRVYNSTGGSLYLKSLYAFLNLNLVPGQDTFVSTLCDPKVLFDCENKRFIAFAMTCDAKSDHSKIMFAFSKNEDPLLGWNVYTFVADQFNKNVWFDHPRIGINGFDVFASGNMFTDALNYSETNIYQLDKMAGYAGDTNIASWAYHNLTNKPFSPSFASDAACGNTGDKSYFIATSSSAGSTLKFYTLTGKANAGVSPTIAYQSIPVTAYSAPGYSPQPGTTTVLRTGDCRSHDAYFLNNKIHFTFHADAGGGYAGIYYTRLKNTTGTWSAAQTKIIGSSSTDWTYPAIAHFGTTSVDETTLITHLSSSSTEFGSMRAFTVDANMVVSSSLMLKQGLSYMNYNPQTNGGITTCRWGDYSGLCARTGANIPSAVVSGMYGNTSNNWTNYICILNRYWDIANGISNTTNKNTDATIYPNPAINKQWNLEINVVQNTFATFEIADVNGKKIQEIYSGILSNGKNNFSFNTHFLASGIYLINVKTANAILQTQKLIIE